MAPYAVEQNSCRPPNPDDPGFAMLTDDPWYTANPNYKRYTAMYANKPPSQKREWFDPDEVVFNEGNSTRKATDEELANEFGFVRCADEECSRELEELGIQSAVTISPPRSSPVPVAASLATATDAATTPWSQPGSQKALSAALPLQT